MPHPKNRLKLTGDTHLPDPRMDFAPEDDEPMDAAMIEEVRVYADGYVPGAEAATMQPEPGAQPQGAMERIEQKVEQLPARKPWMAIGVGLGVGWMLMKMLRR